MTPTEVAEFLGVSNITVSRYLNKSTNPLPCYRLSNRVVRIKMADLQKWMENKEGTYKEYIATDR